MASTFILLILYVIPLVANLSGSIVYYYTLSSADLSLAVPLTNSLTFVFTSITGMLLGEEIVKKKNILGMGLIILGIAICVSSKAFEK